MNSFKIIVFVLLSVFARAQDLQLEVVDENKEAIYNAHIKYGIGPDTSYTISGFDGKVTIKNPGSKGFVIVSHISFQSRAKFLNGSEEQLSFILKRKQGELDEVIITGQAQEVLASKAIRTVTVIDRTRIERQAAVNLRDLLSNDLNLRLSEDLVLGTQLSIGGLGGQKIKILIDGVPVIGRLDGNIDLNQINLNNIERIEIIQGPMAVQYGTDALAGTINLITKKELSNTPKVKLNGFYESVGRYNFDGEISLPIAKTSTNLSLGRNYFDGFDQSDNRNQQWNPKEQYFTQLALKKKIGKSIIGYSVNYFDENISNKGAVGSIDSLIVTIPDSGAFKYPRAVDDNYRTQRLDNAIRYHHYFKPQMALKVHAAYNYYRRIKTSDIINLNTLETTPFGGPDAQDTTVFETFNSRGFFENILIKPKLNYQLGYEFNYEENKGQRIEGGLRNILDAAMFLSLTYKPYSNLEVQPGVRYAYNSQFETPLIYSVAGKYHFNDEWTIRVSYGKGFRAPTLKELYFFFVDVNHNILGNQDLKAESSDNFQINLQYTLKGAKLQGEASLNAFFNDVQNEIRLVSVIEPNNIDSRGLFSNVNVAQTQTTGFDIQSKLKFGRLSGEFGLSLVGVKNNLAFSDDAQSSSQNDFLFYPQYRTNLSYEFHKPKLTFSLFLNHTGPRKDLVYNTEGELGIREFESFTTSDFTMNKRFFQQKLVISLGVKNLFDIVNIQSNSAASGGAHSSGSRTFPVSYGRSYFARIQYNF